MKLRNIHRSIAVAVAVISVSAVTAPRTTAATTASPTATAAVEWLSSELVANDYVLWTPPPPPPYTTSKDWGLTIDAVLALAAAGQSNSDTALATTDNIADNLASYITGADFGSPDDLYAGPIGKALLVATVQGQDPADFGGWDLDATARARMQTSGSDTGRFSDLSFWDGSPVDYSNGLGQALNIMGLARTSGGVPSEAVTFLVDQQCPSGGFRLYYDTTGGCASDDEADSNSTAFAVQALLTSTSSSEARRAIIDATTWIEAGQGATGGIGGDDSTGENSNSTGLGGQTLRAVKHAAPAAAAQAWVEGQQLTSSNAGAASADAGAIALNGTALADAQTSGITDAVRANWHRSTAQAVLAIGLPAYSQIGIPIPPAELSTSQFPFPGDEITVTGSGFAYEEQVTITFHSDPIVVATVTSNDQGQVSAVVVVPVLPAGNHTLELYGVTSELTASSGFAFAVDPGPSDEPIYATPHYTG